MAVRRTQKYRSNPTLLTLVNPKKARKGKKARKVAPWQKIKAPKRPKALKVPKGLSYVPVKRTYSLPEVIGPYKRGGKRVKRARPASGWYPVAKSERAGAHWRFARNTEGKSMARRRKGKKVRKNARRVSKRARPMLLVANKRRRSAKRRRSTAKRRGAKRTRKAGKRRNRRARPVARKIRRVHRRKVRNAAPKRRRSRKGRKGARRSYRRNKRGYKRNPSKKTLIKWAAAGFVGFAVARLVANQAAALTANVAALAPVQRYMPLIASVGAAVGVHMLCKKVKKGKIGRMLTHYHTPLLIGAGVAAADVIMQSLLPPAILGYIGQPASAPLLSGFGGTSYFDELGDAGRMGGRRVGVSALSEYIPEQLGEYVVADDGDGMGSYVVEPNLDAGVVSDGLFGDPGDALDVEAID